MKTHFYLILLILTGLLSSGLQCKKEPAPQKLPDITQEGKGTFGCLIDGEVFLPKGLPLSAPGLECNYYSHTNSIVISATHFGDNFTKGISLEVTNFDLNFNKNHILLMDDLKDSISNAYCYINLDKHSSNSNAVYYKTNNYSDTGVLKILRFDATNRIISGTFWFNGRTDQSSDSIKKITEGRFDLKFNY